MINSTAHEYENLLGQISQLKTSLDHAQVDRRRKIEYDVLAEKINALPTRDELSLYAARLARNCNVYSILASHRTIEALESDMEAIQLEQDTQESTLRAQKDALHAVLDSIGALRRIGKEEESGEGDTGEGDGNDEAARAGTEEGEEREARASPVLMLNPAAKPFVPPTAAGRLQAAAASDSPSRTSTPLNGRGTPLPGSRTAKEDDIEMGEVSEVRKKRKPKEELEEGEASDSSSESGEAGEDS
jgi:THO complex subunit 7